MRITPRLLVLAPFLVFAPTVALMAQSKLAEEQARIRRCVESGRSEAQCMAEGLGKSFKDNFLGGLTDILGTPKAPTSGLRMAGAWPATGEGSVDLTFYNEHVILRCRDLVPDAYAYTVGVSNGQGVVTIQNGPRPLVLSMRADGKLAGSGAVDIDGQVQTGVQHGTRTWADGHTEPISRPIYETRTRRCMAGVMTTSGPSPALGSMKSAAGPVLNALLGGLGGLGVDSKPPAPALPGLRVTGEYGSQAGFDLDFEPEGVVVGCGVATVLRPYSVTPVGSQVTVRVEHGAAPFTLTMGSDGRLTGSGTIRVDGRQATGSDANGGIAYTPRSASCPVGVVAPSTGGSVVAGSAEMVPAPAAAAPVKPTGPLVPPGATGDAVLSLSAVTESMPVGVAMFVLLNEDLQFVLAEAGVSAAPGMSLVQTFARCRNDDPNCAKAGPAIRAHGVARTPSDELGKAMFRGVPPGKYSVMGLARVGGKALLWDFPVELKAGGNTVALTPGNAVP